MKLALAIAAAILLWDCVVSDMVAQTIGGYDAALWDRIATAVQEAGR